MRKEYYLKHKEEFQKKALDYYYKNKKKVLAYQIARIERIRKDNPQFHKKYNIRHTSAHQISLRNKKCFMCGSTTDLQRHHPDYNKPLEIIILCRKCHSLNHTREKLDILN